MKTLSPPLGLLEFLERVQSRVNVYAIDEPTSQLSLALGCRESEILTTSMVLSSEYAPRLHIHPDHRPPLLSRGEKLAHATQVYLLTGYQAEWLPPFGHPHLFATTLDPCIDESHCVYVAAGIPNGWMALTPTELRSLTDYTHWLHVFAA
jgi:hypothetical protein